MIAQPSGSKLTLWSSSDVLKHYGISRQTLKRWRSDPAFPKPLRRVGNHGFIWDRQHVIDWKRGRDRKFNSRKGRIIAHWRQTGNITQTARRCGVPASTLRGWLIDLGHITPPERMEP